MLRPILAALAVLAVLSTSCGSEEAPAGPASVSFARLVEEPSTFDGRRVRLSAFYLGSFERSLLSGALAESYPPQAVEPTVWVSAPTPVGECIQTDEGVTWGEVTAVGTFRYDPEGGFGHLMVWTMELADARLACR